MLTEDTKNEDTNSADTTDPSYWLNWRFFVCALWVLIAIVAALSLIFKFEEFNKGKRQRKDNHQEPVGILYEDEAWNTCSKNVHPAWLLFYRLVAFAALSVMFIANVVVCGGGEVVYLYYTQWTFILVTFYFALGSSLSIYGLWQHRYEVEDYGHGYERLDTEPGAYTSLSPEENSNSHGISINSSNHKELQGRKTAGIWGYTFQILFQICAGAAVLTDIVFWFVLYPSENKLDFLGAGTHSINVIFLLGDVLLNCLRFPAFRLAYFALYTSVFVIFQWIFHARVAMRWPYIFLDLASPYAPLWYLGVGLIHIPCYGLFLLIVKAKQLYLSKDSSLVLEHETKHFVY